jgi:protein-L-isoaspartate(D-aspartate) O-methyltransferase
MMSGLRLAWPGRRQETERVVMDDWNAQRNQMVDSLRDRGAVTLETVERAFRRVPRHVFLPTEDAQSAYTRGAIVTKVRDGMPVSASSDPAVMAIMIEQLEVNSGANVLEIGAGTGYNAAILAEMVGPGGVVTTVDLDEDICAAASNNLARSGYAVVRVECGDGARGVPERAPFDRIIVAVGVYEVSKHWVGQLKAGGIILVPLWIRGAQCLVAFEQVGASLHSRSVRPGGFMRMRGILAGPESFITLRDGWMISAENPAHADVPLFERMLRGSFEEDDALAEQIGSSLFAFSLFVASRDSRVVVLGRNDDAGQMTGYAVALFDAGSASLCLAVAKLDDAGAGRSSVRSYGASGMREAMEQHLEQWTSLGQPTLQQLHVRAIPVAESVDAHASQSLVRGSYEISFSWASNKL